MANAKVECGRCDDVIADGVDAIACEICDLWFHRECVKLNKTQFKSLRVPDAHWFCKSCTNVAKNLSSDVRELKINQAKITKQLDVINAKLSDDSLDDRIEAAVQRALARSPQQNPPQIVNTLASQILAQPANSAQTQSSQTSGSGPMDFRRAIRDEAREVAERDKRQQSIVIKGLGCDVAKVASDFPAVATELGVNVSLSEVVKINNELVRAKILNNDSRKQLLDNAKNLKTSSNFNHVFIRRDYTKQQRTLLAAQRKARNQKSQAAAQTVQSQTSQNMSPPVNVANASVLTGDAPAVIMSDPAPLLITTPVPSQQPLLPQSPSTPTPNA